MAMKKREEEIAQEELESGELNLVPYLDIATNILLFLLASLSSGILFGHINTSLPEHAPSNAVGAADPAKPPNEQPLQLVISITDEKLLVWSVSGLEGTLQQPKLVLPHNPPGSEQPYDLAKLNATLKEIVKRRWPDPKARDPSTEAVIIQADPKTPYETVIAVMDYAREVVTDDENDPDRGLRLFPKVHFSTGFQ
ncbi:MAG: hypothetical protein D6689_17755 [Deltaproteobacteria bacterium]|nr:MAG: hypothetical protein D6689_17755 [Deltaproteobacteria bacterium]